MIRENTVQPMGLLKEYAKYEFVLNVDSKELIDSLFNVEDMPNQKLDLDAIRQEVERFHYAENEIYNISNDYVDSPMFRIQAGSIKTKLGEKAASIKKKIMDRTYKWCNDSVNHISKTYREMKKRIQ